ncbi:basic leucine zipper transcriptional factor ATF-like 2 [Girardinichthys multiradiatus]|uniref:basic leucine zipper transcriptional factor ATF-like 2 n=1 Tax=Girardinichthys multiradiatus TaxID=208333 RepID=UPI001FAC1D14|nr:basic leucine zipper transcriptional factor ATF-like 2 [Girardinichthys multiradiatus]XP_047242604.1 basic leucine zipper transcriptional factor ATF-like 2 [Girardinichthys multiradiatus]
MPLLFMDTGYELSSPCGSLSTEECSSSISAPEREGEGNQPRPRGTKRREKNRDAARKSRRKQTERADELHEELQCLEQSNSALQKEIAALKKDLRLYETALERHKPHCRLKDSGSSPAECKAGSSPPQASDSSSLKTRAGFKTFNNPERTCLTSSASSPTTGPTAAAYSVSFFTHAAPHSLFCNPPPITCPSFAPSTAAQLQRNKVHTTSTASQNSALTEDGFLRNLDSSISNTPTIHSCSAHLGVQSTGLPKQSSPKNVPELSSCKFSGNSAFPQTPAPQTLSVPVQVTSVPSPSPAAYFASLQSYNQQVSPGPESLLSLLTVPSPLNHCQTTSSSFNGSPAPDPSKDMSLSELLEVNDWILSGFGNL